MTLDELRERRGAILAAAARHGARSVRVFGSVARGTADADSDVDLLVELEPGRSLLDLGGLLAEVRGLLGVRVDVATPAGLKDRAREQALDEAVPL